MFWKFYKKAWGLDVKLKTPRKAYKPFLLMIILLFPDKTILFFKNLIPLKSLISKAFKTLL